MIKITTRPKKTPAFPAKARENLWFSNFSSQSKRKPMVFQLFQPKQEKTYGFPTFPAKARENLWFSNFSNQILKKAHFLAFQAFPAGVDNLLLPERDKKKLDNELQRTANFNSIRVVPQSAKRVMSSFFFRHPCNRTKITS